VELEARDLQANLESLSRTSDERYSRSAKLEREKATLEARVGELEAHVRQLSLPPSVPDQRNASRRRSSSLSSCRTTMLERELNEVRLSLSRKENDLCVATESLSWAQDNLMRIGNEKLALEKKVTRESTELKALLEQTEDELQYWKGQHDNGSREEELLQRIEEDEAKITTLEKLLGGRREIAPNGMRRKACRTCQREGGSSG